MSAKILTSLLTPEEVGEALHVTPHTLAVWRCTKRRNLPYVKVGGLVRYRAADVEAFIASNLKDAA